MSEYDGFSDVFDELLRLAERMMGAQFQPSQASPPQKEAEPDELIEGKERFTYLLNSPGYEQDQLLVSVLDDEIEVKAPDFAVRKHLPASVDPSTAVSKYRNGVLSVTVRKRQ